MCKPDIFPPNLPSFKKVKKDYQENVVKRPEHYIGTEGLEVEQILEQFMPFYEDGYIAHRVSSAIEYLLRAPRKNGMEDIKKARYNLDQLLRYAEKED